jgi:hypothetical protein
MRSVRDSPVVRVPGVVKERYVDRHGTGFLFEGQLRAIPEGYSGYKGRGNPLASTNPLREWSEVSARPVPPLFPELAPGTAFLPRFLKGRSGKASAETSPLECCFRVKPLRG